MDAELINTRGERLGTMRFSEPGDEHSERQALRAPQAACYVGPDMAHYAPRAGASPATGVRLGSSTPGRTTEPQGGERIARRCLDGDREALAMFEPEDAEALAGRLWADPQVRDEFADDRAALVAHLRADIRRAAS